jgi:hypothetical protein
MGHKHHYQPHRSSWAGALCKVSPVILLLSAVLFWGSLSIGRSSEKLTQQHSYEAALLPGFHLMEHMPTLSQLSSTGSSALQGQFAAAAQQQHQQQGLAPHPVLSDVPGYSGPPYILPKLIHQTVKDKNSMSCEVQDSIQSWIDMNPGYTHILYDDADLLDFVREHYPQLVDVYQALPTNIERTDTWRYLVLHKLGGVYADSDVKCMQPISTWNQEHNFDAALIVGIAKRNMKTGDTREFNQFVMAAMPGHPVLAAMPMVIASNLAYTYLTNLQSAKGKRADDAVLMRTGPKAFTSAIQAYAGRVGAKWPVNSTQADLEGGVLFGTVRAMPKFVLGTGWDTLDHNMTCEEVKAKIRPEALICHQFFGTWKARPEKQLQARHFTYGDCNRKQQGVSSSTNSIIDQEQEGDGAATGDDAAAGDADALVTTAEPVDTANTEAGGDAAGLATAAEPEDAAGTAADPDDGVVTTAQPEDESEADAATAAAAQAGNEEAVPEVVQYTSSTQQPATQPAAAYKLLARRTLGAR